MDLPHRPFGLAQDWLVPAPAKIIVAPAGWEGEEGGEEGEMGEHLQGEETRPCLTRIDEDKETRG